MKNFNLTHLSLCTGYGGIDLGLKRTGLDVESICYVEIEAFAIANLISKMEQNLLDPAPVWTDLKTMPWHLFKNKVDILSGGFPCQPFSQAGQRNADDDPRHLWPHIVEGVKSLNYPPVLFFENVEGIVNAKLKGEGWSDPQGTPVLLHILREMERMGYHATAGIYSAKEVGAPHQRKRVFILGVLNNVDDSQINEITEMFKEELEVTTAYPAGRGEEQFDWEPPRVIYEDSDAYSNLSELYVSCDSRTDELRLLGNGVVPDTCCVAFRDLWKELFLIPTLQN